MINELLSSQMWKPLAVKPYFSTFSIFYSLQILSILNITGIHTRILAFKLKNIIYSQNKKKIRHQMSFLIFFLLVCAGQYQNKVN